MGLPFSGARANVVEFIDGFRDGTYISCQQHHAIKEDVHIVNIPEVETFEIHANRRVLYPRVRAVTPTAAIVNLATPLSIDATRPERF